MRPEDADAVEDRFFLGTAFIVNKNSIPKGLCFNFDETGISLGDVGKYTMAETASKQVRIIGIEDKRQITVVTATSADAQVLPLGVIWQGTWNSKRAIPKTAPGVVPGDWWVEQTKSHWMDGPACISYLRNLIIPWVNKRRLELGLPKTQKALMIMDTYTSHIMPGVRTWCDENNILVRFVVPGFTGACVYVCVFRDDDEWFFFLVFFYLFRFRILGDLQPQDVAINQPFKENVKQFLQDHHEKAFLTFMEEGGDAISFEADMSKKKIGPVVMRALRDAFDQLASNGDILRRAFARFQKCWEEDFKAKAQAQFDAGTLFVEKQGRHTEVETSVLQVLLEAAGAGEEAAAPVSDAGEEEKEEAWEEEEEIIDGGDVEAEEVNEEEESGSDDEEEEEEEEEEAGDDPANGAFPADLAIEAESLAVSRPRRTGGGDKASHWRGTFGL